MADAHLVDAEVDMRVSATQHEVYEASVRPVIEGIIDGINATIFA